MKLYDFLDNVCNLCRIRKYFIHKLGLKGSWSWALVQMKKGKHVTTGDNYKYRIHYGVIEKSSDLFENWKPVIIQIVDLEFTDWKVYVLMPPMHPNCRCM